MQENRSFDHYYGSLRGVRGFSDKQVLKYQDGTTIFDQPDTKRTDLGYLLPFHMDPTTVDAQNAGDLDHSWAGDHSARNSGLWDNWVAAKTEQTMGYFTRNDLPFNYALADAPALPDTAALITQSDTEKSFPAVAPPAEGAGDAGSGVRQPPAPAEPGNAAGRRHREPVRQHGDRNDVQRRTGRRLAVRLPRQVPDRLGHPVHGRQRHQQDLHVDRGQEERLRLRLSRSTGPTGLSARSRAPSSA